MNITLRPCTAADRRPCEELLRDAFWDLYRPGCVEHLLAHQAWDSPDLVIATVAESDQLDGCLIATRALVESDHGSEPVLYLGPLAVRPAVQGHGIGSALLKQALVEGAEKGYSAAFLFGDPGFYPRFGFSNAADLGVTTADGANFDAFMGIELTRWRHAGRLIESAVFDLTDEALAAFEAGFPHREKHVLPGQFGS